MRKRKSLVTYPTKAYYTDQASSSAIPASCKMLYKCNERSGFPVNTITGHAYDPHNLVVTGGTDDGALYFTENNAIDIRINTSGIGVITEFDATFSTRKVILIAATILPRKNSASNRSTTRIGMGMYGSGATGDSPVLSLSFSTSMHAQFDIYGDGRANDFVNTTADAGLTIQDYVNPHVIYVMWNGIGSSSVVNGTLTAKCLNLNGTVYTNGVAVEQTASGIITSDTFTPGDMMRPAWAHYYKMEAWELDYLPHNLDYKLGIWGTLATQGYKGAIDLK